MDGVFIDYKHYCEWMLDNWETGSEYFNNEMRKIMLERLNNCSGENYRLLTEQEFNESQPIKIPEK